MLYGDEILDESFEKELSGWQEEARDFATELGISAEDLIDRRGRWYRRRFLERTALSLIDLGRLEGVSLESLEKEERELLSSHLKWEMEISEEIQSALLKSRDDYYEIIAEKEKWLLDRKEQYHLLLEEAEVELEELAEGLLREGELEEKKSAQTLNSLVETFSAMEGQQRDLRENLKRIGRRAAVTEGDERAAWLSEQKRISREMESLNQQISEFEDLFQDFISSPLEEDLHLSALKAEISDDRHRKLLALELFEEGPIETRELRQDRISYIKDVAEKEELTYALFRELAGGSREQRDVPQNKEEKELETLAKAILAIEEQGEHYQNLLIHKGERLGRLEEGANRFAKELSGKELPFEELNSFMEEIDLLLEASPERKTFGEVALHLEKLGLVDSSILGKNQALSKLLSLSDSSASTILKGYRQSVIDPVPERADRFFEVAKEGLTELGEGKLSMEIEKGASQLIDLYLLQGSLDAADTQITQLRARMNLALTQAAAYAGVAAACYTTLNIPGGIAATAAAAVATAAAVDFNEQIEDISAVRKMVNKSYMQQKSGLDNPWNSFQSLSSQWKEQRKELTAARDSLSDLESPGWFGDVDNTAQAELAIHGHIQEPLERYTETEKSLRLRYLQLQREQEELREENMQRFSRERSHFLEALSHADLSDEETYSNFLEQGRRLYNSYPSMMGGGISSRTEAGYGNNLFTELSLAGFYRKSLLASNRERVLNYTLKAAEEDALFGFGEFQNFIDRGERWWEAQRIEHLTGADTFLEESRERLKRGRELLHRKTELFEEKKEQSIKKIYQDEMEELRQTIASSLSSTQETGLGLLSRSSRPASGLGAVEQSRHEQVEESILGRSALALFSSPDVNSSLIKERKRRLSGIESRITSLDSERAAMEERIDSLVGESMRRALLGKLADEEGRLRRALDSANRQVRSGIEESLSLAGYQINTALYKRDALVDLWLGKREWKEQRIGAYRSFVTPTLSWKGELRSLRGTAFTGDQGELDTFLTSVASDKREIFFESEGKSLFALHVGEAPTDEGKGKGELGRIYSLFQDHERELGRGLAMTDIAFYDRRFWDDDLDNNGEGDSLFAAPTIRSSADLALQVGAGILLGPGIGAAAMGFADDLLFTGMDMAGGRVTGGEALVSLGKKGVSAGIGQVLPNNGIISTGLKLGSSSALASIDISGGEFSFDSDRFTDTLFSSQSLATLVSSSISSAGNSLYDKFVMAEDSTFGFNSVQLAEMEGTGSFLSSVAGTAGAYAVSGELKLNLLNSRDIGNLFGFDGGSTGLLSLDLSRGRSSGLPGLALESSGTDFSATRLLDAGRGAGHVSLSSRVNRFIDREGYEMGDALSGALRFQYGFGDDAAMNQLKAFLAGKDSLSLLADPTESGFPEGEGKLFGVTRREAIDSGATGSGPSRSVTLYLDELRGVSTKSDAFLLGTVLQHEAHRDGFVTSKNREETRRAVEAHANLVQRTLGDERYQIELLKENPMLLREQIFLAAGGLAGGLVEGNIYDSSDDYYRISEKGELLFDGSHNLWSAQGALIDTHSRGSFSQTLADYLGVSRDDALELMAESGLYWSESDGTYIDRNPEKGIPLTGMIKAKGEVRDRFGPDQIGTSAGERRDGYLWALKEHSYGAAQVDQEKLEYYLAMGELLADKERFEEAALRNPGSSFPGISETATLDHYSQLTMEEAGGGIDYCLAQSIAFSYVERFPDVDMNRMESLFSEADFGSSFNRQSGYVGDKSAYSRSISSHLGVDGYLTEKRFKTLEDLQEAAMETGEDFFVVADYGTHFTHVRSDGLEVNSYPGWRSEGKEPQGWRLMEWQDVN